MSIHEAEVINFEYAEAPWESEPLNWHEWAVDEGGRNRKGEGTSSGEDSNTRRNTVRTTGEGDSQPAAGREERDSDALRRAFEEGRAAGYAEGFARGLGEGEEAGRKKEQARTNAEHEQEKKERAASAAEMISGFRREQERYLHQVEDEVAKLALAIAARILRREAQMDALFLTGAVRVALGQLSESTRVVLQVPEADLGLWTDAMRLVPNLTNRPTVVAGEGMTLGECRVQTEMGAVDLGVKAQLAEIERGFFDGAHKRTPENGSRGSEVPKRSSPTEETLDRRQASPAGSARPHSEKSRLHEQDAAPEPAIEGQYIGEPANGGHDNHRVPDSSDDEAAVESTRAVTVEPVSVEVSS